MKENTILVGSSGFIGRQIKIRLKKKKIISLNSTNINLFSKKSISKIAHKFNNSIIPISKLDQVILKTDTNEKNLTENTDTNQNTIPKNKD